VQDGSPAVGIALLRAGEDLAEAHGLNETVLRAINNRMNYESDRDPRSAFELALAGLTHARRLGRRSEAVSLLEWASWNALRTGDWAWALAELDAMPLDELEARDRGNLSHAAFLFRALRGFDNVSTALAEAVGDGTDSEMGAIDMRRTLAFFAAGELSEARAARHRAAESFGEPGALSNYGARAALWSRDLAGARDDLATFDGTGLRGTVVEADRLTTRAGIATLEGRPDDALSLYREALRAWRALGLAWDEALCGIDMATLLDPADPEVRAAAESAREILVRLEAAPFIARLDVAMARVPDENSPARAEVPSVTPA
jgi:tetratricopeptide (TPR) repeat protein